MQANRHGWAFRPLLVQPPQLEAFRDPNGRKWKAWAVLREAGNGYTLAYDDGDKSFILATGGVVVSSYESFVEGLNAM
jgi:hypothetical protein